MVVFSAVSHMKERATIRNSWAREAAALSGVTVVFLVGKDDSYKAQYVQKQLENEQAKYSDVLQEDFIDTYRNLTLKSVALLGRVTRNCEGAGAGRCPRLVLKTDDDMFINLAALWSLAQQTTGKYVLLGALICGSQLHPTNPKNKGFIPDNQFVGRAYPPFLSGTAYLMSRHTVVALHRAARRHRTFLLEDVFVTGILAKEAGLKPQDHPGFSYRRRGLDLCSLRKTISNHGVTAKEMAQMWKVLERSKEESCPGGRGWAPRLHLTGDC